MARLVMLWWNLKGRGEATKREFRRRPTTWLRPWRWAEGTRGRGRLVKVMHGRGREQTENREGSGWPYMARPRSTMDGDHDRVLGNARGQIGTLGHVRGARGRGL